MSPLTITLYVTKFKLVFYVWLTFPQQISLLIFSLSLYLDLNFSIYMARFASLVVAYFEGAYQNED
jgi:hypothetical protein